MRITKTLRSCLISCCIMAGVSLMLGIWTCIKLEDSAQMQALLETGHDEIKDGRQSAILLTILSIGLIGSYVFLEKKLSHFEEDLLYERRLMRNMFFLFTISYTLRTLYQFLYYDGAEIADHICSYTIRSIISIISPLLWEVIPDICIMYWHHANFKTRSFRGRFRPCCPCLSH